MRIASHLLGYVRISAFMDPAEATVAVASIGAATTLVAPFVTKIAGAIGDAAATSIDEWFAARRNANAKSVVASAAKKADDRAIEIVEVPLRLLHPLLEAASLEDDPSIQDLWAELLVHAADRATGTAVHPSHIEVLKQLWREEALFVDAWYKYYFARIEEFAASPESDLVPQPRNPAGARYPEATFIAILRTLPFVTLEESENEQDVRALVRVMLDNMVRLRLLTPPSPGSSGYSVPPYGQHFGLVIQPPPQKAGVGKSEMS